MRTTGRRKTTSHAWKKQGPGKNSACPLISSRSPHTRSDQSEPTFAGIRPTGVPPFRAAQIVGARFAFFVSLAHGSMSERKTPGKCAAENHRLKRLSTWCFEGWKILVFRSHFSRHKSNPDKRDKRDCSNSREGP